MKNISILLITDQLLDQSESKKHHLDLQIDAICKFAGLNGIVAHSNIPLRRDKSREGEDGPFGMIKVIPTYHMPPTNKEFYDMIFLETIGPIVSPKEGNQLGDNAPKFEEVDTRKGFLWHYLN